MEVPYNKTEVGLIGYYLTVGIVDEDMGYLPVDTHS